MHVNCTRVSVKLPYMEVSSLRPPANRQLLCHDLLLPAAYKEELWHLLHVSSSTHSLVQVVTSTIKSSVTALVLFVENDANLPKDPRAEQTA